MHFIVWGNLKKEYKSTHQGLSLTTQYNFKTKIKGKQWQKQHLYHGMLMVYEL